VNVDSRRKSIDVRDGDVCVPKSSYHLTFTFPMTNATLFRSKHNILMRCLIIRIMLSMAL
jgi:hypothetical protein